MNLVEDRQRQHLPNAGDRAQAMKRIAVVAFRVAHERELEVSDKAVVARATRGPPRCSCGRWHQENGRTRHRDWPGTPAGARTPEGCTGRACSEYVPAAGHACAPGAGAVGASRESTASRPDTRWLAAAGPAQQARDLVRVDLVVF